jgi:hypothetical protein
LLEENPHLGIRGDAPLEYRGAPASTVDRPSVLNGAPEKTAQIENGEFCRTLFDYAQKK